jgi:hypothetical protein
MITDNVNIAGMSDYNTLNKIEPAPDAGDASKVIKEKQSIDFGRALLGTNADAASEFSIADCSYG